MKHRSPKTPVDPTPPMMRGETEFEEAQIKRDFIAVFTVVSNAMFHSLQETLEYAYRAGFSAGKVRRDPVPTIEGRKLPSYIRIL